MLGRTAAAIAVAVAACVVGDNVRPWHNETDFHCCCCWESCTSTLFDYLQLYVYYPYVGLCGSYSDDGDVGIVVPPKATTGCFQIEPRKPKKQPLMKVASNISNFTQYHSLSSLSAAILFTTIFPKPTTTTMIRVVCFAVVVGVIVALLGCESVHAGGRSEGDDPIKIPRACSTPTTSKFPFCDTSLSVDERVDNLISYAMQLPLLLLTPRSKLMR